MLLQLAVRFLVGGTFVSAFALLGDILHPKSFAGLLGAAPSIALATLSLTIAAKGKPYAAIETKCMIAGAFGFFVYASLCAFLMKKVRLHALTAAASALAVWLLCAVGLWLIAFR